MISPTEESPVYDGTPIKLPSGRVTLKAVCVNQYGKMSPTLEVGYKFNVSPYPLDMYGESDNFGSFTLNKTSIDEFKAAFGNPSQELETTYLSLTNSARHLQYNWGYAVFILENSAWQRSAHRTCRRLRTRFSRRGCGRQRRSLSV